VDILLLQRGVNGHLRLMARVIACSLCFLRLLKLYDLADRIVGRFVNLNLPGKDTFFLLFFNGFL